MSPMELPRTVENAVFANVSSIRRGEEQPTGLGILVQHTRAIGKLLHLKGLSFAEIAKQVQEEIAKSIIQFIATFETSPELTPEQEEEIVKQIQEEIIRQIYEEIMARALEQAPEEMEINVISSEQLVNALTERIIFDRLSLLDLQVLQINSVFINSDRILQRLISKDISLETRLASDIGWANFDLGSIRQLVFNLVANACDAMPNGGRLIIETANITLDEEYTALHPGVQPGEYVLLIIHDTGLGISDEIKDKIFDPFFTTKDKDHSGLGLAVVFGIVKQHGGQIQIQSKVGIGSTFKVYLPRVAKPTSLPNLLAGNAGICNLIQQKMADYGKKL